MQIILRKIQFDPDSGDVDMLMEHAFGTFFLHTTESALEARLPAGASVWDNGEAVAEAEALLSTPERFTAVTLMPADLYPAEGFTVILAPKRAARLAAEAAVPPKRAEG